jgi:hypothetical protein
MAESPPFGAIGDRHRAGSDALDSPLAEIATIWCYRRSKALGGGPIVAEPMPDGR